MTPQEVLTRAAKVLEDHEWIQGNMATDEYGLVTHVNGPSATCFCALGAIHRVVREVAEISLIKDSNARNKWEGQSKLINDAGDKLGEYIGSTIPSWNDSPERTKEEVINALKEASKK